MVRQTELIGVIIVMIIVFMMILPLPLFIVDIAISLNICIASLLAIQSLFLQNPVAFSTFPAVLLLTTVFRLALSVSTTRLILLQHDAGHIVDTFGNFVAGGNLAVGMVIFLILTIVNFLVITKGAERVAEVSARFTLDAMPGKQMAIDSDLRSGLIDTSEACLRRDRLNKESQLFGAMDGAMKFVKGDAISGIIIVFINLLGGFSTGILQNGMSGTEAMHIYSVLSIGDGLITQIPALLISLSAGIVITRVTSDNTSSGNNIGSEIAWQLTRYPKAWIYSAVIMLVFSAIPGMPAGLFAVLSLLCLSLALVLYRQRQKNKHAERERVTSGNGHDTPTRIDQENVRRFFPLRAYLIQFHPQHQDDPDCSEIIQRLHRLRNTYVLEYGLMLPDFELEFNESLAHDEFRFCLYEVPLIRATYDPSRYAVNATLITVTDEVTGTAERDEQQWCWLEASDPRFSQDQPEYAKSTDLILERMKNAIIATGWQFIGLQECRALIQWLKEEQPELADELERSLPVTIFASVLQRLAAEHITLRPVRLIVESLLKSYHSESNLASLHEHVRYALRWHICQQYGQNGSLSCWLLTPYSDEILRSARHSVEHETFITLDSPMQEALFLRLKTCFPTHEEIFTVLLVEPDLRDPIAKLLRESLNHIPVLSFTELIPSIKLHVRGRLDIEEAMAEQAKQAEQC